MPIVKRIGKMGRMMAEEQRRYVICSLFQMFCCAVGCQRFDAPPVSLGAIVTDRQIWMWVMTS